MRPLIPLCLAVFLCAGTGGIPGAFAYFDTLDGPVAADARLALKNGDVTPALKWVNPEAESEVRAAFNLAVSERTKNPDGKEASDTKFCEALVRIHCAAEGIPFEGLKPPGSSHELIRGADAALASGSCVDFAEDLAAYVIVGIKDRFDRVVQARTRKDDSVEAGREYVGAYIEYMNYAEYLSDLVAPEDDAGGEEDGS